MNKQVQRKKLWQQHKLAIIRRYKLMKGCKDCGYREHYYALEFDHSNPEEKVGNICHMIHRTQGWNRIKAEVAKCDVVCANCHRIRTYNSKHYMN